MKIPQQAKKVFSGIIFDVYQWEQKMFDETTETFEMLKRPDTIQVIATMDEKIILIEEEQPTIQRGFGVIGGRQDENEDPLACAKRELLEETGLASDDWELWQTREPYNKIEWTIHRFIARNCKKVADQNLDAGEKIEIKPVDFDEFLAHATSGYFGSKDITFELLNMYYKDELETFKQKLFNKQKE
ncbi:MAG TPA: hypothetical protein DCS29_00520 [Candidatus Magasanikbacteria bacterium]|nr:hypothetical protein [Candidatus Magasanikbacteria bacterium]